MMYIPTSNTFTFYFSLRLKFGDENKKKTADNNKNLACGVHVKKIFFSLNIHVEIQN